MQTLASGVGDLKRVLSNVTTRGAWGEVQLENLLTQMLAPDQFERNVSPTGSGERVEFAIKLPEAWLPIDAKFPSEAYQRLVAASERTDAAAVERCAKELETVVRACAKTFSVKYLAPPKTTDFGILFLAPRASTPKSCAVPDSPNRFRANTASSSPAPPPSPRFSIVSRWALKPSPSSSVPAKSGTPRRRQDAVRQILAGARNHSHAPRSGYPDRRRRRHPHASHRAPPEERRVIRRQRAV